MTDKKWVEIKVEAKDNPLGYKIEVGFIDGYVYHPEGTRVVIIANNEIKTFPLWAVKIIHWKQAMENPSFIP